MHAKHLPAQNHPLLEDIDELEIGAAPEDLDDGLVAPFISDDPEHDRVIDPED